MVFDRETRREKPRSRIVTRREEPRSRKVAAEERKEKIKETKNRLPKKQVPRGLMRKEPERI
jgi:hypothetical protein